MKYRRLISHLKLTKLTLLLCCAFLSVGCAKLQAPVDVYSPEEMAALEAAQLEELQLQDEVNFEIEMENDLKQFELESAQETEPATLALEA